MNRVRAWGGIKLIPVCRPLTLLLPVLLRAAGFYIEPLVGWRRIMLFMSCTGLFALIVRRSLTLPNTPIKHRVPYSKLCGQPAFRVSAAFILAVLKLGTYWTCYTWLPTFLHKHMHQSIAKSFRWIATSQVGQFTGMLLFGRFSDFIGRRPAFVVYGLLTAAAIACLAFQWPFLSAHPSLFWTVMFTLGLGSGCTGGLGALMAELFPTEIRSLAMGKPPFCRRRAHTHFLFLFFSRNAARHAPLQVLPCLPSPAPPLLHLWWCRHGVQLRAERAAGLALRGGPGTRVEGPQGCSLCAYEPGTGHECMGVGLPGDRGHHPARVGRGGEGRECLGSGERGVGRAWGRYNVRPKP